MQVASRPNNEKSIKFKHSSNYTFTKKIVKSELVNVKYIHFLPIQIH